MRIPEPNLESKSWPFVLAFAKHMEARLPDVETRISRNAEELVLRKQLRDAYELLCMDFRENSTVQILTARCEWIACIAMKLHYTLLNEKIYP